MTSVNSRTTARPHLYEPTLDEILADPIIGLILRRDGLTVNAVRAALDSARQTLVDRPSTQGLFQAA